MNSKQSNILDRSRALKALFANNPTLTATVIGLPAALEVFHNQLDVVEALGKRQGQRLEVALLQRDNALAEAIDAAMELGGIVLGYAERQKLAELATNVRVQSTDFRNGRLEDHVRLAQHVHDVIEAQLPTVLTEIGVTAAMLSDLQKKIDAADAALAAPRVMVVEKSSATEQLVAAFRELTAIQTRQLDPLMVPLEKKNPEFYAKYRSARILIDRPGTRVQPNTGTPVPPADVVPVAPATVQKAA